MVEAAAAGVVSAVVFTATLGATLLWRVYRHLAPDGIHLEQDAARLVQQQSADVARQFQEWQDAEVPRVMGALLGPARIDDWRSVEPQLNPWSFALGLPLASPPVEGAVVTMPTPLGPLRMPLKDYLAAVEHLTSRQAVDVSWVTFEGGKRGRGRRVP